MPPAPSLRRATALAAAALLITLGAPIAAPAAEPPPAPRLVRADATGAVVELRTPAIGRAPGGGLAVAGAAPDQALGDLPAHFVALGVPPTATITLHVAEDELRPLPARLAHPTTPAASDTLPAPLPADPERDRLGLAPISQSPNPQSPIPQSPNPHPTSGCTPAARITGDAWMRGQRIVTVALSPVAACADGALRWRPALRAELRWDGTAAAGEQAGLEAAAGRSTLYALRSTVPPDPLLDAALPTALLNFEQARAWRVPPPAAAAPAPAAAGERYQLSITTEGLYSVAYADLQAAGADVATIDPRTFRLTTRGEPVAILVDGEADGRFDPGDSLSFYGRPLDDRPISDSVILGGTLVLTDTVVSRTYSAETDYGDRNVYWLEVGGQPGPRMATVAAAPIQGAPTPASFRATARAEQSLWWWTWHFTSRDTWFWSRLTTTGTLTESYPIDLPDPDPAGAPAELTAEVVALSHSPAVNPDHRTRLTFNGAPVVDQTWDGPVRQAIGGQVPAVALVAGANALDVGYLLQPGVGADTLYFNWFEVAYSRLFRARADQLRFDFPAAGPQRFSVGGLSGPGVRALDVAAPLAPRLLTGVAVTPDAGAYRAELSPPGGGGSFLVVGPAGARPPLQIERRTPSTLRDPANGADYIVVAPAQLRAAAQTLAAYRAAQGMRTAVVDLGEVIDEFNHGIYHPVAIKRFLAYAYVGWQAPAPQYVLLVGDGHWNFRDYSPGRYGGGGPILMPPNLAWVDPFQGQVDSANQLAAIVGDDILPDLAIGRLTARTADEVAAALAKTAAHEAAPADAPWRRRLLFIADNQPDSAGNFPAVLDRVIATTVPTTTLTVERLDLDPICGPAQNPPRACPTLATSLTATLNDTGALMLTYSGHGAVQRWAHEQVYTNAAAQGLRNAARPPLVVSLDCLDGYWSYPGTESLIEELVRMGGGGAAAAFSPTGLGVATGHEQLQRGLHARLFGGGQQRIGPASMAAKLQLFAGGASLDLVDTYTVFGDPALIVALPEQITGPPERERVSLPLIRAPGP